MNKTISVVDCFVKEPVIYCFNQLVANFPQYRFTYHCPSKMGIQSLKLNPGQSILVLGSASHVHEKLHWHNELAQFLDQELHKGVPVLGICFGHQLMAAFYGGQVGFYNPNEDKILGSRTMEVKIPVLGFKDGEKINLTVTHRQVVKSISNQLEAWATSENHPFDALKHRQLPFYSVQAHPESSTYFCHNDVGMKEDSEILRVQKDGKKLVSAFLSLS